MDNDEAKLRARLEELEAQRAELMSSDLPPEEKKKRLTKNRKDRYSTKRKLDPETRAHDRARNRAYSQKRREKKKNETTAPKKSKTNEGLDNYQLLLDAANRFACIDLKMETETNMVQRILNEQNAIQLLLFADSHSCALLKDASMKLICRDGRKMMATEDWNLIEKSAHLQSELLGHMFDSWSPKESDKVAPEDV